MKTFAFPQRLLQAATFVTAVSGAANSLFAQTTDGSPAGAGDKPVTLFNILPLKPEAFPAFLPVMQANASASRREQGNFSFDVFQPEDGAPRLYLFERWAGQAALDKHMTQPNLKAVLQRADSDLAGEASSLRLSAVPGLGADARKPFATAAAAGSRNVIVLLSVKPEREQTFLEALAEVTPHARRAPGNHAFELYAVESQPRTYLLFERWDNAASHEAHLAQDYSKRLDAVLPGTLAAPVGAANRFLVKDVATD
ncbi:putative quinol monooxygenase [Azotobacter vinelandii]|uniref:putative quinol monooxygenase n=1 Tax=Azotobacter vinelandii TaxID=354 RepID=UPI000773B846|nr:antibiotic biosynthesis monooxygenase [Azotobacter vinelandii]